MLQTKTSEYKYKVNNRNQPKPFSYIPDSPDPKKTVGNDSDLFKISLKTDQQESIVHHTLEKIPKTLSPPRNIDLDEENYVYENPQQPKTYQRITCNFCNTRQETFTIYQVGKNTYLVMVLILLLFLPLFWVPLFLNECKDKVSICSVCNRATGIIPFRIF